MMKFSSQLLALFLACLAAGTASAQPVVTSETTPGGIAYQRAVMPDAQQQSVQVYWRDADLKTNPQRFWIYLLSGHSIAGGPAGSTRGDFTETLKDMQATMRLNFLPDAFHLGFTGMPERLAEAAELVGQTLHDPALRRGRLDSRRDQMIKQVEQERLNGEALAGKVLLRRLVSEPAIVHPALSRDPELLKSGDPAALRNWMRSVLTKRNMVVATAGPMDAATVGPILDKILGRLPAEGAGGNVPAVLTFAGERPTAVVSAEVAQTVIIGGGPAHFDEDREEAALAVANATLAGGFSSRLYRKLREELGATYGVRAYTERLNDKQFVFVVRSAVDHDRSKAALDGLIEEYGRWHRDGITEAEFRDTRARLIAARIEDLRRPPDVAAVLARAMLRGERANALAALRTKLESLTHGDVNSFITRMFPPRLTLVVVTPRPDMFAVECRVRTIEDSTACR